MTIRSLTTAVIAAGALVLAAGTTATASTTSSTSPTSGTSATTATEPQLIHDEDLKAQSTTMGGAKVLPTTKTIPHWYGATKDPSNGVTYGYNMVAP